jgi:hypothetical protein
VKHIILPNDVSFSQVEIQEGMTPSTRDGYWANKYPNGFDHPAGNWFGMSHYATVPLYNKVSGEDRISSGPHHQPPAFEDGSYFQWNIPWFYRIVNHAKNPDKYFILITAQQWKKIVV